MTLKLKANVAPAFPDLVSKCTLTKIIISVIAFLLLPFEAKIMLLRHFGDGVSEEKQRKENKKKTSNFSLSRETSERRSMYINRYFR